MPDKPEEPIIPDKSENGFINKEDPDFDMQIRPFSSTKQGCSSVILLVIVIIAAILMAVG